MNVQPEKLIPAEPAKIIVTDRPDAPDDKAILETRAGVPDVQAVRMRWWTQVLVRGARTYAQNVIGYLLTAGVGATIAHAIVMLFGPAVAYAADTIGVPTNNAVAFFYVLLAAMSAAVGPTIVCLIQNWLEISAEWDKTNPKFRA